MRLEPLRPNDIPGKLTMAATGLMMLTYVIVVSLMMVIYVKIENYEVDGLEDVANLLIGAGTFNIIVYVALIIVFLIWFSRAYHNIKRLGKMPNHDIGWSIGGWFVPILWWFRPWEIYREIAETYSTITKAFPQHLQPDTPNRGQLLGLGGWWWGTYVGFSIVSSVINRLTRDSDDFDLILFVPPIVMMIPTVLLFLVVRRTNKIESVVHRIWASGDYQTYIEEREMAKAGKVAVTGEEKPADWYKTEAENEKQLGRNEDPFQ
jgi:Domain of unknown function (DUF4328)